MQQQIVKNSLGCRCPRAGIGLLPPAPALAGSAAGRSALHILSWQTPLDPAASSTTDGVAPPARPWHPGGRSGRAWQRLPFYRFFPGEIRCRPSGSGAPASSGESTSDSSITSYRALLPRRRANPLRSAGPWSVRGRCRGWLRASAPGCALPPEAGHHGRRLRPASVRPLPGGIQQAAPLVRR